MRAAYHDADPLAAEGRLEDLARQLDKAHPGAVANKLNEPTVVICNEDERVVVSPRSPFWPGCGTSRSPVGDDQEHVGRRARCACSARTSSRKRNRPRGSRNGIGHGGPASGSAIAPPEGRSARRPRSVDERDVDPDRRRRSRGWLRGGVPRRRPPLPPRPGRRPRPGRPPRPPSPPRRTTTSGPGPLQLSWPRCYRPRMR